MTVMFLIILYYLVGFAFFKSMIAETARESAHRNSPVALLVASLLVLTVWIPVLIWAVYKTYGKPKPQCNCHSWMQDEKGKTIHYDNCDVVLASLSKEEA